MEKVKGETQPGQVQDTQNHAACCTGVAQNLPPDLAGIVEAWPRLPSHIRAAVLALVNTAGDGK